MAAPSLLLLSLVVCAMKPAQAPSPRVVKVENAGLLFTDNPAGISGTDCGYSLPIGREVLWVFGDVFLLHPTDPAKRYVGGVSNCGLLVPSGTGPAPLRRATVLTDAATGLARPLLANAPGEGNELRYWLFGGHFDEAARRAFFFYARIRTFGPGPFDFRCEGHGLAAAPTEGSDRLRFSRLPAPGGGDLWWTGAGDEPLFGTAVARDPVAGWLYVWGVQERGGAKQGKVSRVRPEHIADRSRYEYYAGGSPARWSASVSDAADVVGLTGFSEASVSYNTYLGGWLAVHSLGLDEKVRLCLADNPWGPFRTIGDIGAPHRAFEKAFCYAGKEHPELRQQGGRVLYITYVDGQRYWLQMMKVTLAR